MKAFPKHSTGPVSLPEVGVPGCAESTKGNETGLACHFQSLREENERGLSWDNRGYS